MAKWLRGHSDTHTTEHRNHKKRTYCETRHVPYPGLFSDRPVISETAFSQSPAREINSGCHFLNQSFPELPWWTGSLQTNETTWKLFTCSRTKTKQTFIGLEFISFCNVRSCVGIVPLRQNILLAGEHTTGHKHGSTLQCARVHCQIHFLKKWELTLQ